MEPYLEAGTVRNVHGIRGDLTVGCLCDSPKVFAALETLYIRQGGEYRPYRCTKNQPMGGDTLLVHLDGIESREEGAILKGRPLYASRADLPPLPKGSYYIADLLNLPVIDAVSGKLYGRITDVQSYGASDLYEITGEDGKTRLLPAVPSFIDRVELDRGVYVTPIEGLLS